MFAKGPPCTNAGVCSSVWTRFGASASRRIAAIAPCALRSRARTGVRSRVYATTISPEPLLEVGEVGREAEDRHHLAGHDDVEAVLAGIAVGRTAEPDHGVAQRAVVDVEHAPPGHAAHVDAERVAVVHVVVEERREQVRRDPDRREVPGEVQVDVFHRHDLGVAAAGGAALHPEHRTERGLAQADHGTFARCG